MSLYQEWESMTPDPKYRQAYQEHWDSFFKKEENNYKQILGSKTTELKGTVAELASNYNMTVHEMTGFLDGINESLVEQIDIETLEEDTEINSTIDYEKLLFNMHKAKADWLYNLEEWKDIFDEEKRKEIKKEYSNSGTIYKEKEPGRNDPCPCGSGKKYKKCCMKQK